MTIGILQQHYTISLHISLLTAPGNPDYLGFRIITLNGVQGLLTFVIFTHRQCLSLSVITPHMQLDTLHSTPYVQIRKSSSKSKQSSMYYT